MPSLRIIEMGLVNSLSLRNVLYRSPEDMNIDFVPYQMIKILLEWHVDIFGLIDKGLAIEINTITNE